VESENAPGCQLISGRNIRHHGRRNLKTPTPFFNVVFTGHLFGGCSNFVGSESGQKQCKTTVEYVYSTIQHPPPPVTHTVFIYCTYYTVHLVWEGGGVEVREKEEGQQYASIVPSSMGATVHKLGQKYKPLSECISSL
jgi:hypothetical protein